MTLADLRRLITYNNWANARTFDAIAALDDEQLRRDLKSSFPSVLLTASHLAGAEWIWLERWLARPTAGFPAWVLEPTLGDVRARLQAVAEERDAFLAGLSEADVDTPRPFRLINGTEDRQPLDVMITHVVNHSSYHRGQITAFLRQLGLKAVGTDFIQYARDVRRT